MRLGNYRIELMRATRLPLGLSATVLSSLIVASLLGLPPPYNIIAGIALGGPLFVSLYGLKKQAA